MGTQPWRIKSEQLHIKQGHDIIKFKTDGPYFRKDKLFINLASQRELIHFFVTEMLL